MKNCFYILCVFVISINVCTSQNLKWRLVDTTQVYYDDWDPGYSGIDYKAMDFNNKKNIVAVGNASTLDPAIMHSTDCGETWKFVYIDTSRFSEKPYLEKPIIDVAYPDITTCVAVAKKATIGYPKIIARLGRRVQCQQGNKLTNYTK